MIPINWTWSIQENDENQFIVPFPNKVELQRMIAIGNVNTKAGDDTFRFAEWTKKIEPFQVLQRVWINVYGVPFEIRNYLSLWAVGSILGATKMMDMVSTRRTGVVRIMVAVMDATHIPNSVDIVVDDGLYPIFFKVEKVLNDEFTNADDLDGDDSDHGKHHG